MISRKDLLEREYATPPTEQLTTVTTDLNSTVITEQLTTEGKVDQALAATADLINNQFKPWYAKMAYRIGVDHYLGLAAEARQVKVGSPRKVFSASLKRAVNG